MSEEKSLFQKYRPAFLLAGVVAVVIFLIVNNFSVVSNVLLAFIGFGFVVLVHEFGHFIVAKLSDIKVEAFSIGFSPVLAGILRTEKGWRVRILPKFFPKENDQAQEGRLSFTIGKCKKADETEYCIGLIPFGGFVKMLGQEDTKTAEATDDPRSYANKSPEVRMAVIVAGVLFNVISALIVFVTVFLIGINRVPPVIGTVEPNSPAAIAGLRAGDEVVEIDGKSGDLEFSDIAMAAALSKRDEAVVLKVKHTDGSVGEFSLIAKEKQTPMGELRLFGVMPAQDLTIAKVSDVNALFEQTGLRSGDRIISVNGWDVQNHWQLAEKVESSLVPFVTLLARRTDQSGKAELVESQIRPNLYPANSDPNSESDLGHIYSMVPRLKVASVDKKAEISLQNGDIIVAAGDIENPTYKEFRDITEEYQDKKLAVTVLRKNPEGVENEVAVTVIPKRQDSDGRVVIGIGVALDAEHAVVAKTISAKDGPAALAIPRGALITAVDGVKVSNFYDCIKQLRDNAGQRITVDYRVNDKIAGDVALEVGDAEESITVIIPTFAELVPFKVLERLYKADGPVDAAVMGYRKTVKFIMTAYITLQRFVSGQVSAKGFMGPIGILTFSYKIVSEQPIIYYVYFMGLISAFIAVFNLLPLLPFDGGHLVFLAIEKIKGSAVSERVQGAATYVGLVLVGTLALYVTFNDIVRSFFSN